MKLKKKHDRITSGTAAKERRPKFLNRLDRWENPVRGFNHNPRRKFVAQYLLLKGLLPRKGQEKEKSGIRGPRVWYAFRMTYSATEGWEG